MTDKTNKQPAQRDRIVKIERPAANTYRREVREGGEVIKKSAKSSDPFTSEPPKPPKK